MNNEDLRSRLVRYSGFLRTDPSNIGLINEVADLHIRLGELEQARSVLDQGLTHFPDDAGLKFRMATVAIASGTPEKAIAILRELHQAGIDNDAIRYNLGYALLLASHFEEAKGILSEIQDYTAVPQAPLTLARTLHHLAELEKAIAHVKEYLAKNPNTSEALGLLAILQLDSGNDSEAKAAAEKSLSFNPNELYALITLGSLALAIPDEKIATIYYDRAVTHHPQSGRAWSGLGLTAMLRLDIPNAARYFTTAVEFMPNHIGTWHSLAWCQIMLGDLKGARASFEKAMDLDRNFAETHGGLAVIAVLEKRYEDAQEILKPARRLNANAFSVRYAQGLLDSRDDPQRAQAVVRDILSSSKTGGGESLQEVLVRVMAQNTPPKKGR